MRPLQVWLPLTCASIGNLKVQADFQRALAEWRGELRIWFLPDLKKPLRWKDHESISVLAVPAEHLDRVDIYHIGENGHIWGPGSKIRFYGITAKELLDSWLNTLKDGEIRLHSAPLSFTAEIPYVDGDSVKYIKQDLAPSFGGVFPVVDFDETTGRQTLGWPPKGQPRPSASIEGDSDRFYGPLKFKEYEGELAAYSERYPEMIFKPSIYKWSKPLDMLMPIGAGGDDIAGLARMIDIAQMSNANPEGALWQAKEAAQPYISEGKTIRAYEWFWPRAAKDGAHDAFIEAQYRWFSEWSGNDRWDSFEEAAKSEGWNKLMFQSVPIKRAWGALGLFWALLLEQLEERHGFQVCEKCGKINQGKRDKKYCSREDNEECFRERTAHRQRKARSQRMK